ncbi:iron ABC transporter permease [Lentzea sp. NBRC 105346]|uniref:ABC transporter permease n=1 Tax=Lentzea sp. NBRC 105346 TaxID=3032205 RepID=UPI0024A31DFF|nr:iron ABC transporter permease [Lentzea sp. NBRC 105346]GLZ28548.1 iron ABC transporter permease [Lentzea sp. NBRC 105346]
MTLTLLRRRVGPVPVLVFATGVALLALLPLGFVVWATISTGWAEAEKLIFRPRTGELLWNTVRLTAGAVALCAVIGTATAWLVERSNLPVRKAFHVLLTAPLAIPAFVNSYAWVSLLPSATGYGGALLIVTLSYFPFVHLPVAAAFQGLDPALEETAHALGLSRWRTFTRVVLPQLRPALLGGALLVALHLLAEFGALQMLRFPTFTTAIYDQYQSTYNGPAANMLAVVLVLCCLLLLVGELKGRGRARLSRVGTGVARPATRARLGRAAIPVLTALCVLVALSLAVPLASLTYWLSGSSAEFDAEMIAATATTSLALGALGAVCTVGLAIPVAWLVVRHRNALSTFLERSTYFGNALPGIVVALALVTIGIQVVPGLYQTTVMLLAAYAILFLPRAVVNVRSALAQAPPVLDDVAHSLGSGRLAAFRRVTLPLIAPGLGAGAALVFIAVVTELTATLLLAPIGTTTLATQFWSHSDSAAYGAAAPYAALMVLLSVPATYLLTREGIRR